MKSQLWICICIYIFICMYKYLSYMYIYTCLSFIYLRNILNKQIGKKFRGHSYFMLKRDFILKLQFKQNIAEAQVKQNNSFFIITLLVYIWIYMDIYMKLHIYLYIYRTHKQTKPISRLMSNKWKQTKILKISFIYISSRYTWLRQNKI